MNTADLAIDCPGQGPPHQVRVTVSKVIGWHGDNALHFGWCDQCWAGIVYDHYNGARLHVLVTAPPDALQWVQLDLLDAVDD